MRTIGNRWLVLIAMTGSLAMIMLDQTVVTVALPSMTRELPLTATGQQWVVNAYVLAMAALVALGGKLGDRFGGVTTFRAGVLVFFLASAGCGLAPQGSFGEPWLIGARVLQGAGAALMMPVSAAIVIGAFAASERGRAMAIYAGISQVFLAVGPLLGGLLTEYASWRLVFWLNVPIGLAALALVHIAAPANTRRPDATIKAGPVALLVGGVALTVLGIQQASVWSWSSSATWIAIGAGVVLTTWFAATQLRSSNPLIDLRLLARRAYLGNVAILGLVQFALLAVILFSSLYSQDLLHFSPMVAGVGALPLILAIAAAAQIGGRWYDRSGVRPPVLTGLAIAGAGLGLWAAALPQLAYLPAVPGMVLLGFGIGLVMSPTNTDALSRVSASDRSQASGIVQTVRQLGGTLGVAIIGAVVLAIESHGTQAGTAHHAADAMVVGYVCAAAAFAVALFAGWRLLSHERPADEPSKAPELASAAA